jgi:hypothetical protein
MAVGQPDWRAREDYRLAGRAAKSLIQGLALSFRRQVRGATTANA